MSALGRAAVVAAALYLVVLGIAMQRFTYDVWGALVVAPVLFAVSAPLINRAFAGEYAWLVPYAWFGLAVKFVGSVVGYYVRFDAYGGSADAGRYHSAGVNTSGNLVDFVTNPFAFIPSGQGTRFLESVTKLVYTIGGSSRMGGFLLFTWMSYWGLVFFIKAAALSVPDFAVRRYAMALFCFPSLVYWGSSIGKEAVVGLGLGVSSYGLAIILARDQRFKLALFLVAIGLYGTARTRPHFAAVWIGAAAIALAVRAIADVGRRDENNRSQFRLTTVLLVLVAIVGFGVVATITLDYLAPPAQDDEAYTIPVESRFGLVFDNTEDRTTTGGSKFTPVPNSTPLDWPYAAYRTLTRPLVTEARGLAAMMPALEMTALLVAGVISWRRLLHTPRLLLRAPLLVFALISVITFGVAFASIGNLGILVRQRSLVLPLMLIFWCLPPLPARSLAGSTVSRSQPAPFAQNRDAARLA